MQKDQELRVTQLCSKFEASLKSSLDYKSKKQLRSEGDGMCFVEADDEKLQCALSKQGLSAAALNWAHRHGFLSCRRLGVFRETRRQS